VVSRPQTDKSVHAICQLIRYHQKTSQPARLPHLPKAGSRPRARLACGRRQATANAAASGGVAKTEAAKAAARSVAKAAARLRVRLRVCRGTPTGSMSDYDIYRVDFVRCKNDVIQSGFLNNAPAFSFDAAQEGATRASPSPPSHKPESGVAF
jgi:hypothetical protein